MFDIIYTDRKENRLCLTRALSGKAWRFLGESSPSRAEAESDQTRLTCRKKIRLRLSTCQTFYFLH